MNEKISLKGLNILVVEDKPEHQDAARILLAEHNLTLAGSYYEALRQLDEKKTQVLLTDMKIPLGLKKTKDCPKGYSPTSDKYEPRDLGYAVALHASRPHIAVPKICVLTDTDHHSDAISATFDEFIVDKTRYDPNELAYPASHARPAFKINNSIFVMYDSRDLPTPLFYHNGKILTTKEYFSLPGEKEKIVQTKNWKEALERILQEPSPASSFSSPIEGA